MTHLVSEFLRFFSLRNSNPVKKLLFITICLASFSCSRAQGVEVGADKSFNESLNNYNTFGWFTDISQIPEGAVFVGPNGVYIFNTESTRSKIKDAIRFELNAKGYKETENKPGILVDFEITEQAGTLLTFNGYTRIDNGSDSIRTPQNKETVKIKPGTLLINLLDAKSGKVAWQGYASGILNPDMINNNVKVSEAVSGIFKEFKFHAKQ